MPSRGINGSDFPIEVSTHFQTGSQRCLDGALVLKAPRKSQCRLRPPTKSEELVKTPSTAGRVFERTVPKVRSTSTNVPGSVVLRLETNGPTPWICWFT